MKSILRAFPVIALLAVFAFASTIRNATYKNGNVAGNKTLKLTGAKEPDGGDISSFKIPANATITVYDKDGKKLDPQPELKIDPELGTNTTETTITTTQGEFPTDGKVVISEVDTSGSLPAPGGQFQ